MAPRSSSLSTSLQSGDWNSFIAANGEGDRVRRLEGRCESGPGQKEKEGKKEGRRKKEGRDLAQQSSIRARLIAISCAALLYLGARRLRFLPISPKCLKRNRRQIDGDQKQDAVQSGCLLCVIHKSVGSVQGDYVGFNTENGEKLSYGQTEAGCLAVA